MPSPERLEVTLLTQEDCSFCDQAAGVLARLSERYPLSISKLPLDSEQGRELAASAGVMFPPGVFVDGEPFSYGRLSERKLRRELERRLEARVP